MLRLAGGRGEERKRPVTYTIAIACKKTMLAPAASFSFCLWSFTKKNRFSEISICRQWQPGSLFYPSP